jgi:3-oxoacyl-[acyl-carrier-protein] synthase II
MSGARVVITGMGWVTPLGDDVPGAWARIVAGESGVSRVDRFEGATFRTNFAAQVRGFDLARHLGAEGVARHAGAGLSTSFALAAAAQAVRQAGLDRFAGLNRRRFGVYMGAGEGTLDFEPYAAAHVASYDPGKRACDGRAWAAHALATMDATREVEQEPNMSVSHVAWEMGCLGPASNCMTACAAGAQSVGEAFELLRRGDVDVMLAGGAHSMIHPLGMTGFIRLTAMSRRNDEFTRAARPFDRTRDGFVMGEGAGVLVLETLEHAQARGATPLAEVAGYGSSADAYRITDIQPDGRGAVASMALACAQAGIDPQRPGPDGRPPIHYISAHGTGTKENDSIETRAVKALMGPLAGRVPFSSVKSTLGHLIQAAGTVELITCVMAMKTGVVPPTMNLSEPDPACDLDYVPNAARDLRGEGGVSVCLSNSFGFGGQNDTVCVRAFR